MRRETKRFLGKDCRRGRLQIESVTEKWRDVQTGHSFKKGEINKGWTRRVVCAHSYRAVFQDGTAQLLGLKQPVRSAVRAAAARAAVSVPAPGDPLHGPPAYRPWCTSHIFCGVTSSQAGPRLSPEAEKAQV